MSLLRVFRYLWEGEPVPDPDQPTVILGSQYAASEQWDPNLLLDIRSRIWLMYRTNFPLIPRHPQGPSPLQLSTMLRGGAIDTNGFVTDVGWGCMIRTGQCLVANGLLHLIMGRDWRASEERTALPIVQLFADTPSAPLSLHNFVSKGIPHGKLPGQWFGPSTVAACLKALCPDIPDIKLNVYVSEGSDIYRDVLETLEFPLLVLCPVRLGINEINATYYEGVKACLKTKQSVGIAGGRISASHYFYGYQGNRMFFHDPHIPKQALDLGDLDLESIHSDQLRAMDLSEMDPSMLIGFLLKDHQDYVEWQQAMDLVPLKSKAIVLSDKRPEQPLGENEVDGYVLCEEEQEVEEQVSLKSKEEEVLVAPPQVEDEASVLV